MNPLTLSTLKALTLRRHARTKRVSSYDKSGGNSDCWYIPAGETATLADISGAGCITHIWFTVACKDRDYLRKTLLKMSWDNEPEPSVYVPLGDFFGLGHGIAQSFVSAPLATVAPAEQEGKRGGNMAMNSYWQMPFAERATIQIVNECDAPIDAFYFYIDYEAYDSLPEDVLRFHAQYRQECPTKGIRGELGRRGIDIGTLFREPNIDGKENYVILEAEGAGHYVGCVLSVHNIDPNVDGLTWWGEGDDMFFIDGEELPSLHGTGSEDYFCHAWGMHDRAYPYAGTSIWEHDPRYPGRHKCTSYRFHIQDPVVFTKSLKVTIEHGHANLQNNDYSSVAFWYQTEPHRPHPPMPDKWERCARPDTLRSV